MPYSRLGQKLTLSSMAVSCLNASLGFTILKKLSWISQIWRFFNKLHFAYQIKVRSNIEGQ